MLVLEENNTKQHTQKRHTVWNRSMVQKVDVKAPPSISPKLESNPKDRLTYEQTYNQLVVDVLKESTRVQTYPIYCLVIFVKNI